MLDRGFLGICDGDGPILVVLVRSSEDASTGPPDNRNSEDNLVPRAMFSSFSTKE